MSMGFQSDHFIILLPYKDVVNPPEWVTKNFKVSPGGRHADGRTENKLVIFSDGTYLELIAFVDDQPEKRKGHWWDKPYGIVDFALTSSDVDQFDVDALNTRIDKAGSAVRYQAPIKGGRTRPDGVEMEWKVTFPFTDDGTVERGMVPFFCHDLTPRERRVPVSKESATHPSAALGVAGVKVSFRDAEAASKLKKAVVGVTGSDNCYVGQPIDDYEGNNKSIRPQIEFVQDNSLTVPFRLSLTVEIPAGSKKDPIEQNIGDGMVRIEFR